VRELDDELCVVQDFLAVEIERSMRALDVAKFNKSVRVLDLGWLSNSICSISPQSPKSDRRVPGEVVFGMFLTYTLLVGSLEEDDDAVGVSDSTTPSREAAPSSLGARACGERLPVLLVDAALR